ncbi:MAG: PepSY-like domain-containing protein [Rikenellaceae bacterium]
MIRTLSLIITAILLVGCGDEKPLPVEKFPYEAQKFLHFHYPYAKAAQSTVEGFFSKEYEVKLDNLVEVTFNSDGEPIEMDCKHRVVPMGVINSKIVGDFSRRYGDAYATGFEIEDNGNYKVDIRLFNGSDLELIYTKDGKFLGLDD